MMGKLDGRARREKQGKKQQRQKKKVEGIRVKVKLDGRWLDVIGLMCIGLMLFA